MKNKAGQNKPALRKTSTGRIAKADFLRGCQLICEDTDKIDICKLWLKGFPGRRMDGVLIPIVTTQCHFGG